MINLRFVLKEARREARATRRQLLLLTASVVAGVAALVAINSFTINMRSAVASQARALLGADLSLSGRRPLAEATALAPRIEALLSHPGVEQATSISLPAMAWAQSGGTRLIQLRTVDPNWPWYGSIETDPSTAWQDLQQGGVVVDPGLLATLSLKLGDTLGVGNSKLPIIGTVLAVPGDIGLQFSFGARVFMATTGMDATGLLAFGSRATWETYFKLPEEISASTLASDLKPLASVERLRLHTVADDRDQLTDNLTRLGDYLGLVALAALLLGGLGVASAVHVFIRRKLATIAILRCLGATSTEVLLIQLCQAATMGLLGSIAGALLGLCLQHAMPWLLGDFIPVNVSIRIAPAALLTGVTAGLWTAIVFAFLPLLAIRDISPLATLRGETATASRRSNLPRISAALLLVLSVVLLASIQARSLRQGAWFAVGIALALLVLRIAAWSVIQLARRSISPRWPYLIRQGIANLYRPANQTVTVVVALGFGCFILATILLVQDNLLRELRITDAPGSRPDLAILDIQPDQLRSVDSIIRAAGVTQPEFVPLIPMRLKAIRGVPITDLLQGADSTAPGGVPGEDKDPLWAWRREYRSSWRAGMTAGEKLTAGQWFDSTRSNDGLTPGSAVEVSLETGLADELGVGIGDLIDWDLQGVTIHSRITSLREVNWARFELNFFAVFAPGAIDSAPQMLVTLIQLPDPAERGALQRDLVRSASNLTTIDLGEVARSLDEIIGRIVLTIRFMALFSLATGSLVLIGAINTSRRQRIRESTLLRTLGAARRQVVTILATEYAALGLAASLVSVGLALTAGWLLARFRFEVDFTVPVTPLLLLSCGVVGITLLTGLASSLEVLRRPPLEILRRE